MRRVFKMVPAQAIRPHRSALSLGRANRRERAGEGLCQVTKTESRSASLTRWVEEHGPYDLSVMRFAMHVMRQTSEQNMYNLAFEAFASKARVMIDFLTGRQKASRTEIKAAQYFPGGFSPPARNHLNKVIEALDGHALHPSHARPTSKAEKIDIKKCEAIGEWVEAAVEKFIRELPNDGPHWNRAAALDHLRIVAR